MFASNIITLPILIRTLFANIVFLTSWWFISFSPNAFQHDILEVKVQTHKIIFWTFSIFLLIFNSDLSQVITFNFSRMKKSLFFLRCSRLFRIKLWNFLTIKIFTVQANKEDLFLFISSLSFFLTHEKKNEKKNMNIFSFHSLRSARWSIVDSERASRV